MKSVAIAASAGFLWAFAASAFAQRPLCHIELPALDQCLDSSAGFTTGGRVECGGQEAERQDARLQVAWQASQETLTDGERRHLRALQDVWLRWRRLRCDYIDGDPDSGSEARAEAGYCYADMTAERALELEAMQHPPRQHRAASTNHGVQNENARMAAALTDLLPTLTDWEHEHLIAVQQAWLRWRSLRSAFLAANARGHSGARAAVDDCYAETTAERADELEDMQYPSMLDDEGRKKLHLSAPISHLRPCSTACRWP